MTCCYYLSWKHHHSAAQRYVALTSSSPSAPAQRQSLLNTGIISWTVVCTKTEFLIVPRLPYVPLSLDWLEILLPATERNSVKNAAIVVQFDVFVRKGKSCVLWHLINNNCCGPVLSAIRASWGLQTIQGAKNHWNSWKCGDTRGRISPNIIRSLGTRSQKGSSTLS